MERVGPPQTDPGKGGEANHGVEGPVGEMALADVALV